MGRVGLLDRMHGRLRSRFVQFFSSEMKGHEGMSIYANRVRNADRVRNIC